MSIAREIVNFAIEAGSSDIHLEEESPIAVRVNSDIKISPQKLTSEDMDSLLLELLGSEKLNDFNNSGDLDTSIGLEGLSRLRINAYIANEKRCLTLRLLPNDLPRWQDLGLPDSFINLSKLHRGLVLCTGPTGSGKSTTLAAFINCMLETQCRHIFKLHICYDQFGCMVCFRKSVCAGQTFKDQNLQSLHQSIWKPHTNRTIL